MYKRTELGSEWNPDWKQTQSKTHPENFEVHELWIFLTLIKTVTSQNGKDQGHPPLL